jgi:hypothetical protein
MALALLDISGMVSLKRLTISAIVLASLLAVTTPGRTQDEPLLVQGRVAWIAGRSLVLVPDGRPSIHVDLSQVPQDQHGALREGDRIVVRGALPNARDRLIAASVERLGR